MRRNVDILPIGVTGGERSGIIMTTLGTKNDVDDWITVGHSL
jgi:hypothetical protein